MTNKPQFVGEYKRVKLSEICSKGKSSLRQKDVLNDGPYSVYGASGIVGTTSDYQNEIPYVVVVKDGAGVGRASACEPMTSVLGTMQALIPNSNVERDYLLHLVRSLRLGEGFSGSTIPHIYFKDYGRIEVPLPSLEVQKQIVSQLGLVEAQITQVEAQIEQLDQLAKSRFVEMFGDPIENPFDWRTKPLSNLGNLKNGVNFKSVDSDTEIRCLSVSDFKDRYQISNMELISSVSLNNKPNKSQLLRDGDVVFVRSNGNKRLVGRCLAIFPGDEDVTFSGFCIRFRNESNELLLDYLLGCLKSDSMRKAMTGRGANIQNLSQKILSEVVLPIPPLTLQQEFATFVQHVDKSRFISISRYRDILIKRVDTDTHTYKALTDRDSPN